MDNLRMDRRTLLASGAVSIAGLAGCTGTDNPFGDSEGEAADGWEIRLGALVPQSGHLEQFSDEIVDAIELVEAQFDQIIDPNYDLNVTVRDTESDPETAAQMGQELVDDGHEVLIGPGSSESLQALKQEVLQPESVVTISFLAAAGLTQMDNDRHFYTMAPRTRDITRGMERAVSLNQIGSVSIIHSNEQYGVNINEQLAEGLISRGIEVYEQIEIDDEDESPSDSYLDQALADGPEGIVFACNPGPAIPLMEEYYANYETVETVVPDRLRIPDLPSQIGSDMDKTSTVSIRPGWEQVAVRDSDSEEAEDEVEVEEDDNLLEWFDIAYESKYDRIPSIHAAQAFDATVIMAIATIGVGEDNYDGSMIGERIEQLVNPQSGYEGIRSYSVDNYWEGLAEIEDGIRNNYNGATGQMELDSSGVRSNVVLEAADFAPETDSGFEHVLPIHL